MKLRWSPTSPFVRKVVVLMKEKGIEDQVAKEKSNPLNREDRAATPSPLGKIPCLVTDAGQSVFDSPVIMEYLDVECGGPEMLPKSGDARWTVLRRQATADGMIDSMVTCFVESLKKPERQSGGVIAHNKSIVFMGIALSTQVITSKLTGYIDRLIEGRTEIITPQKMDALQLEIHRIEQTLTTVATRPNRVVHRNQPPSPLAEHQKIIDLAG